MTPTIPLRDSVTLYKTVRNDYGTEVLERVTDTESLKGMLIENVSFTHQVGQDAVTNTGTVLHLDSEDDYLKSINYRLEGYILGVAPYGGSLGDNLFRVVTVIVCRDLLRGNEAHHIECQLERFDGYESQV